MCSDDNTNAEKEMGVPRRKRDAQGRTDTGEEGAPVVLPMRGKGNTERLPKRCRKTGSSNAH